MQKPNNHPQFRYHTISEFQALQEQRVKTEEVADNSIYEAMTRLMHPQPNTPEVISMAVRVEHVIYERTKNEMARISLQIILLDADYQPSISRPSTMTNGIWSFEKSLQLTTAKPMKVGFLLPSLPDDSFEDPFTTAWMDIREDVYA